MNIRDLNILKLDNKISVIGRIRETKVKYFRTLNGEEEILLVILKDESTKDTVKLEISKKIKETQSINKGDKIEVEGILLKDKELKDGEIKLKIKVASLKLLMDAVELGFRNVKSLKNKKIVMVKEILQNTELIGPIEEDKLKEIINSNIQISVTNSELEDILEILNKEGIIIRPKRGFIQIIS